MDKNELLKLVQTSSAQGLVAKDELIAAFDAGTAAGEKIETDSHAGEKAKTGSPAGISHILYYTGAAVVFIGISVLIGQNWSSLSGATKILCTLGSGVAAYIAAVFLGQNKHSEEVSRAFYFVSALVIPVGLQVTFHLAGLDVKSYGVQSVTAGILLATFLASYFADRKTVFTLFNIIFASWLFFSVTAFLVGGNPNFGWRFSAYRYLCIGLTYVILGYYFTETPHRALTGALYGFGSFCFLGAALSLGGWTPNQNIFWELSFPGLVFGVMFLSVHLKSKAFLTFGSLYLMAYILKITSEYFQHSLGWPLTLVLAGLGLIAIGALHINLKRRYLS